MDTTPDKPGWWTPGRGLAAACALAGALFAVRMVWHVFFSGLTLAEDEAHYWLWSTRPGWGYYSKGPGTAWLIGASTALFGHSEWAVRLPAAACSALGMVGAAFGARWALPREPAAPVVAAALYALIPGFAVAAMLMTIDAPFLACWVWGGAFAAKALLAGRPGAWIGLGCCVGVGLLFKHTILLLPVGAWLAAWTLPGRRRAPLGVVLAAWGAGLAGLAPMLAWNAAHDWATLRHLLGHLSLPGGDSAAGVDWNPAWTAEMLGVQAPVIGGTLALALIGWWRSRRTSDEGAARAARAMVLIGLPVFAFYLLVSLLTRVEGIWAMAGAATMTVPAAWAVIDAARNRVAWVRWVWRLTVASGALVIVAPSILGFLSTRRVFGPYIPVERVTGMREHAAAVRSLADRLRDETGLEPFVMADHYGRASQLWFYLPDLAPVYSASAHTGGRRSQFDLWADTDLAPGEAARGLAGRPGVLIGAPGQQWRGAFERIEPLGPLPGEPSPGSREGALGHGFRGFGPAHTHDRGDDDGQ